MSFVIDKDSHNFCKRILIANCVWCFAFPRTFLAGQLAKASMEITIRMNPNRKLGEIFFQMFSLLRKLLLYFVRFCKIPSFSKECKSIVCKPIKLFAVYITRGTVMLWGQSVSSSKSL